MYIKPSKNFSTCFYKSKVMCSMEKHLSTENQGTTSKSAKNYWPGMFGFPFFPGPPPMGPPPGMFDNPYNIAYRPFYAPQKDTRPLSQLKNPYNIAYRPLYVPQKHVRPMGPPMGPMGMPPMGPPMGPPPGGPGGPGRMGPPMGPMGMPPMGPPPMGPRPF